MAAVAEVQMQPLMAEQRLQSLDVVRGVALFGILLMNLEAFVGPPMAAGSGLDPNLQGVDRWADALIYIFVQGKFFTLFSLLFGMGFAVMSQRADATGRPFGALYVRRAAVLMLFGVLHALLIWSGDILFCYGLLSLVLIAFRAIHGRWLVALGVGAYLIGVGWYLLFGGLDALMQLSPEAAKAWNEAMGKQQGIVHEEIRQQALAFGTGSYGEAVMQRLSDFGMNLAGIFVFGPIVGGMFLLGKWFVESGAIVRPTEHASLFWKLRWIAAPAGLTLMLLSFYLQPTVDPARITGRSGLALAVSTSAGLLMCLGYLAWMLRGLQSKRFARLLAWFASAGRMALTNYLMQSVICTAVFYGYGLGYFGAMGRAWQVLFAVVLIALQVMMSRAWLSRYRFGPMEWLWRSLTYLKPQPMRLSAG